jgi:predicted RNA binding protein YcfA (HicA-like mRNA interferase family)
MSRIKYRVQRNGNVNMTAREMDALLRRWGFESVRTTGGHHQYQHPDKPGTVTMRSPGRPSQDVHGGTAKQAAAIMGVGVLDFLNNPPTREKQVSAQVDLGALDRRLSEASIPVEESAPPAPPSWVDDPALPLLLRAQAWAAHHGEPFTTSEMREALNSGPDVASLNSMLRRWAEQTHRTGFLVVVPSPSPPKPTIYGFDPSAITVPLRTYKRRGWDVQHPVEAEASEALDSDETPPMVQPIPAPPAAPAALSETLQAEVFGVDSRGRRIIRLRDGTLARVVPL